MLVKSEEEIEGDDGRRQKKREACNGERDGEGRKSGIAATGRGAKKRGGSWKEEERPVS